MVTYGPRGPSLLTGERETLSKGAVSGGKSFDSGDPDLKQLGLNPSVHIFFNSLNRTLHF